MQGTCWHRWIQIGHISLTPALARQVQTSFGQEPLNSCKHTTSPYFTPLNSFILGPAALQRCCAGSEWQPAPRRRSGRGTDSGTDRPSAWHGCTVQVGARGSLQGLRWPNLYLIQVLVTGGCRRKHGKSETSIYKAMDLSGKFRLVSRACPVRQEGLCSCSLSR